MSEQWYEQDFKEQQPQPERRSTVREKTRSITVGTLVVCLLFSALIGGGIGGAVVYGSQMNALGTNDAAAEKPTTDDASTQTNTSQQPPVLTTSTGTNAQYTKSQVATMCQPSVVGIEMQIQSGYATGSGSGSGVIISKDGYIVTNNHVVENATSIKVYLQDGTSYDAEVIGTDPRTDLAVIKINATGLTPATLGNSETLAVGDDVLAIGNPLGELMSSVTSGSISGLNRTIVVENQEMTLLQTDAAINPGNSGGGLFNLSGELIGIVNAKSMGYEVEGIGFAIPINDAKQVITDLMEKGYVTGRPYLGISMQEVYVSSGQGNGSYGFGFPFGSSMQQYEARVQVVEVVEGSAADQAGIRSGDMILSLEGETVEGLSEFTSKVDEYNAGDVVKLMVQRGTQTLEISVTLGEKTNA